MITNIPNDKFFVKVLYGESYSNGDTVIDPIGPNSFDIALIKAEELLKNPEYNDCGVYIVGMKRGNCYQGSNQGSHIFGPAPINLNNR